MTLAVSATATSDRCVASSTKVAAEEEKKSARLQYIRCSLIVLPVTGMLDIVPEMT